MNLDSAISAMPHHCDPPKLQQFITCIFQRVGAEADVAGEVARHLVRSNLSGHDSHGVIRVAQYIGQVDNGDIVPSARPIVMNAAAVTALVDARRGFGLYST